MERIKRIIIEVYEKKSKNFKKRLLNDFLKAEVNVNDRNRNIMLAKFFSDMAATDTDIKAIDKPINLIEETLFNYLLSSK